MKSWHDLTIIDDYDVDGIIMDVYVEDSNRAFDIKMQTTDKRDIEKRTRYNDNTHKAFNNLTVSELQEKDSKLETAVTVVNEFGLDAFLIAEKFNVSEAVLREALK